MGNSSGSYHSTRENSMAAFDKLPPTIRAALANAAFCYAPQPIRTRFNRGLMGYRNVKEVAATIRRWDAEKIAKDRKRVWGITDDAHQEARR